jgi:hypothetical protein
MIQEEQRMRSILSIFSMALLIAMVMSCSDSDSPSAHTGSEFTLKVFKNTGENPFAQLAYQCRGCSFEQFAALEPPPEWSKGPTQVVLPMGELRSTPSFDGVPSTMDFIPEIPGNEFELIAKTLAGSIVEIGENGLIAMVEVMRDTLLRYPAGGRVHELTDPEGNIFVLFVYEVDSEDFDASGFEAEDALANHPTPEGWTYSTRILNEDLIMDTNDVATVLAFRGDIASAWQKR